LEVILKTMVQSIALGPIGTIIASVVVVEFLEQKKAPFHDMTCNFG